MQNAKLPPQAIELERAVLGALLLDKDAILAIANILPENAFYSEKNGMIYKAVKQLSKEGMQIDLITISNQLRKNGNLEQIGGYIELVSLANQVGSSAHIEQHAKIVAQKYVQRVLIEKTMLIQNAAFDESKDLEDILMFTNSSFDEVYSLLDTGSEEKSWKEIVNESIYETERRQLMRSEGKCTGVPTPLNTLNKWTQGWQGGQVIVIAARPSMGKEQPLYSKILTPDGWSTMGKIKIGDKVIGSNGQSCNVIGTFPQGVKDIYRVHFSDETFTDCGLDHLWLTKNRKERRVKSKGSVKTTRQIIESLKCNTKDLRYNHSIDYVSPIEYEKKNLLIEPYLLGAYIGDGSYDTTLKFSNTERDICDKINSLLPNSDVLIFNEKNGKDHYIKRKKFTRTCSDIKTYLKEYNLTGKAKDKFIPVDYLYSSVEDRINLLHGLIDTDGYAAGLNSIEYSTVSEKLKDGIIELVRSLGGRVTYTSKIGTYTKNGIKHNCSKAYRINISFNNGIVPCSSKKHLAKYKSAKRILGKFITNIELIGQHEAKCIMVDSKDHLYVTDDYILTHNTAVSIALMKTAAENGFNPCYFSLETSSSTLASRMLLGLSDVDSDKFRTGDLNKYDWAQIEMAADELKKLDIYMNDKSCISIDYIKMKCRALKRKNKCGIIFIDYLQLASIEGLKGNREQEVAKMSRECKVMAKELQVPVILLSQLSRKVEERADKTPMLSDLRESGAIEQDADMVLFLNRPEKYGIEQMDGFETTKGLGFVIIAKNKEGRLGEVPFRYNDSLTKISDWNTFEQHENVNNNELSSSFPVSNEFDVF